MRSVTLNNPYCMLSCALRHRLGFTVSGAGLSSPMNCLYDSMSQATLPSGFLMVSGAGASIRPRCASSKSCLLAKSSCSATALLAAMVADDAGFGAAAWAGSSGLADSAGGGASFEQPQRSASVATTALRRRIPAAMVTPSDVRRPAARASAEYPLQYYA